MLQIVHAYDRRPIAEVDTEGADALEAKLGLAARSFRDRDQWNEIPSSTGDVFENSSSCSFP